MATVLLRPDGDLKSLRVDTNLQTYMCLMHAYTDNAHSLDVMEMSDKNVIWIWDLQARTSLLRRDRKLL